MTKAEKQIYISMCNLMFMVKRTKQTKKEIDFENYHITFEFKEKENLNDGQ